MISRKILYGIMLISSMLVISCEDDLSIDIVDDKVYVLKPGLNELEIKEATSFRYDLYVMKSGVGKQETDVQLSVNESVLNNYNESEETDYSLLPAQYYTIASTTGRLGRDDYRVHFEIVFDTQAIIDLQTSSGKTYALPCEVKVLNSEIEIGGDQDMTSLLVPIFELE